jgi:hypothetical protein
MRTTHAARFMRELFAEKIQYGGIFVGTRMEVYDHAHAAYVSKGADKDTAHKCAENFAMRGPELTKAEASRMVPISKLIASEAAGV